MTTSGKLITELKTVLQGDAWYGRPVYTILEAVSFETAYEKPPGAVHNIAEMVLHMLAWTEETIDRLNGMSPKLPSSGDWPDPGAPDEQKWQEYVNDLKLVNVNLLRLIGEIPEDKWSAPYQEEPDGKTETDVTAEQLVRGLVQHHIYHSGQIALLTRIITG